MPAKKKAAAKKTAAKKTAAKKESKPATVEMRPVGKKEAWRMTGKDKVAAAKLQQTGVPVAAR